MNKSLIQDFCNEAKKIYKEENVLLHRPVFKGNEKEYLEECIDSNFVSSVGKRVDEFESKFCRNLKEVNRTRGSTQQRGFRVPVSHGSRLPIPFDDGHAGSSNLHAVM